MADRTLDLRRSTQKLVVDHFTVHPALGTVSVHVLEKDAEGKTLGGQDIDSVTAQELSITGELAAGITGAKLVSFVSGLSQGVAVELDKKPEPAAQE